MKKTCASLLLGGVGIVAHAQSSVTLYGIVDNGFAYQNNSAKVGSA